MLDLTDTSFFNQMVTAIGQLIIIDDASSIHDKATAILNSYIYRTKLHKKLVKFCSTLLLSVVGKYNESVDVFKDKVEHHDDDKLTSENLIPAYAVYCEYHFTKNVSGFHPVESVTTSFNDSAWPEHRKMNAHHVAEHYGVKMGPMWVVDRRVPVLDIIEMVADWMAMGIEKGNSALQWFNENQNNTFCFSGDNVVVINDCLECERIYASLISKVRTRLKNDQQTYSSEGLFDPVEEVDDMHYNVRNFPLTAFFSKLRKKYKTSKMEHLLKAVGMSKYFFDKKTVEIHKFFIPEILYLLDLFRFSPVLRRDIYSHTWVSELPKNSTSVDMARVKSVIKAKLYPHQEEFLSSYSTNKDKNHLRGYLLSFEQGLGKTITSIALMEGLNKDLVIIICPKNTMLETWKTHVDTFVAGNPMVYVSGVDKAYTGQKYCIFNYDAMNKLQEMIPTFVSKSSIGIIVDESHNFLRSVSLRTQLLINIARSVDRADILLMSGTPLKCTGLEMLPMMTVLDPLFDDEAQATFKLSFGVNTEVATDVLNARLQRMMTRVTKDVLNLPEKTESTIMIKMPTGNKYTAGAVKKAMVEYMIERTKYHQAMMPTYREEFNEAMNYLQTKFGTTKDFQQYCKIVKRLVQSEGWFEQGDTEVSWANTYEKTVLEPALPKALLDKFRHSKTAIKYLRLKIRGEVLGDCVMKLRIQMTTEMLQAANMEELINEAEKKTLIFTSYVDTIEVCEAFLTKKGYTPLCIYGKTSDNLAELVKKFQTEPKWNPLIASLLTLSTGATLTAANRVIFLNKPWRSIEYQQASDRVHRIGQDCNVDIISLVLDTGEEPNLSTRMEDIMNSSAQMFGAIVDNKPLTDIEDE